MNDQEVSKQLAEIVKPMVRNELQLFQQQQKEMLQIHSQSAEATHINTNETISETTAYTAGHQGSQLGQVQLIKRPSNALKNLGLSLGNIGC